MNNSSATIQRNASEIAILFNNYSDHMVNYGIHGISIVGTLFNLATVSILFTKTQIFRGNFYDFLRCRCICNLVTCIICIYYQRLLKSTLCEQCPTDYIGLYIDWFAFTVPLRVAFLAAFIADIFIVLNRLANIYDKKKSVFYSLSKKVSFDELLHIVYPDFG